ncbi:hypothetical protein WJX73_001901 [Symbiochloris irregularis]|uniref:Cupin 2 conserved barrel domain-containing protein n=1 Tax=Symbiochloris irregularis TaxID=706552 RepID=A0AAW1NVN0_9CHLO
MRAWQRGAIYGALFLGLWMQRDQVLKYRRSRPQGRGFAISHTPGVGQWGEIRERLGRDAHGRQTTTLTLVFPKHDTMPGFYKGHPSAPPIHRHLYQDETFIVEQGTLGYVLDGKEGTRTAKQGPLTLPYGHFHTFWNADQSRDLRMKVQEVTRVGNKTTYIASYFESLFGLSRDYGGPANIPRLQGYLTFTEGGHLELQANKRIQWLIPTVLCPVAKLIGYKATYREYESKLAGAPDLTFSLA